MDTDEAASRPRFAMVRSFLSIVHMDTLFDLPRINLSTNRVSLTPSFSWVYRRPRQIFNRFSGFLMSL
jgi:hypothetical protein